MSTNAPCYVSHDANGHEKLISLEEVFEDFLFNDFSDFGGGAFGDFMCDEDKNMQSSASSSSSSSSDSGGNDNGKKRKQTGMSADQKKDRRYGRFACN